MIGHPKYTYNDVVTFKCDITGDGSLVDVVGTVEVVDSYGTFFDDSDVQYDVLGTFHHTDDEGNQIVSDPIFFKHVHEGELTLVERHDARSTDDAAPSDADDTNDMSDADDTDVTFDATDKPPVDTEPFRPRQSSDEMKHIVYDPSDGSANVDAVNDMLLASTGGTIHCNIGDGITASSVTSLVEQIPTASNVRVRIVRSENGYDVERVFVDDDDNEIASESYPIW